MKNPIITVLSGQILLLLLTCSLAAAASQPELQKIRHTVLSPTAEQVTLQFNGSYSPKIFTLKDETPRVIFDFPEMTYGREIQATTTTKGSMVKRIRVGKHTGETQKTRIVFDMATLTGVTYTQKFDNKSLSLVIEFTSAKPAAALSKSKPAAATDADPSKAKVEAKKIDEKKVLAAESAQVPPESTGETKSFAKTETTPPASTAESLPATSKEASLQPVAPAEKTEEKKTPTATIAPSQPEATVAAKTEATQVGSTATVPPAPPATSPKQTITVVKAEEKILPTPTPASPDTAAKTPVKTEPTQAETTASAPPAPPVPSPKPAEAVAKPEEKVGPPPAPAQPETVAKTPVKTEPTQAETSVIAPPAPPTPSPKPAETVAKQEEKVVAPPPPPAQPETAAKTPAKTEAAKPAAIAGGGGPRLESVRFDGSSIKGEMILFKLNDFHPPVIHGVEEGVPRVICDFNGMQLADSVKSLIKADGKHVKIIRVTKGKKPDRVRVVLDLAPNRSYDLQQVFFKEDNLFVIIVNTTKK